MSDGASHRPAGACVSVKSLSRVFGTEPNTVDVLRGIDLEIEPGERLALLGRSGSGKSTLLHLLAALDQPTSGSVHVDGTDLAGLSRVEAASFRGRTVGLIFQAFHLIADRNAWRNVELPLIFQGVPPAERQRRCREMLAGVGLEHRTDHRPAELSGGEKQRVAVARALAHRPRLLLADEPTGNLDTATAGQIVDVLLEHVRRTSASLVIVTHDPEVARRCADRTLNIADGRLH